MSDKAYTVDSEGVISLPRDSKVLVISDTHFPYHHENTFYFIERIMDKIQPDLVIHNGDLTDSYAFSRYPKDSEYDECYSVEFSAVRQCIATLGELCPDMFVVSSNHDDRLWDRAKSSGIPKSVLLPFRTIIGADKLPWTFKDDLVVKIGSAPWYFSHYRGANVLRVAEAVGMSYVQGHTHTKLSVSSTVTLTGRLYGCECGCLLGDDRHAFAYNKASIIRPNLGCLVISKGVPHVIPMGKEML